MLSRVADSLYWMSRYFERADHSARVLEANYNLLLNPSKLSREQRWSRITLSLGLDVAQSQSQTDLTRLITQPGTKSSLLACISSARENASQVREQISSEMWERLNQLYHEISGSSQNGLDTEPVRVLAAFREGTYKFHGVTESTMNHGEGWYFIQVGKYMERATNISRLLDAHFLDPTGADDLDWVGLLASCSAFEAYRKVNTSELGDRRVAEFLLLNEEFPYTIRYSAERLHDSLNAINYSLSARKTARIDRIIGKLRASLAYAQIEDILKADLHIFLNGILEQCHSLHSAIHELFIEYPIESAIEV